MSRLSSLSFAVFPVFLALAAACDDESGGSTDAGQDARRDGSSGCRLADCQGIPKPPLACTPPTIAEFTCVRTYDQRCTWGQERCAPGGDGGVDTGGTATDGGGTAADTGDDAPADAAGGS